MAAQVMKRVRGPSSFPALPPPPQVPHWSSLGRLKRSKFPSLGGGGHTFGGGAGALGGRQLPCAACAALAPLRQQAAFLSCSY